MNRTRRPASYSRTGWLLAAVFAISMVMGTGPGVLLVNRPVTFLGLPLVYAWGIFWYFVQVALAIAAYFTVWNDESRGESPVKRDRE